MSLVENIIRADVRALSAYHVPDATGFLKLDAMENPYTLTPELQQALAKRLSETDLNRYPVPSYAGIKTALSTHFGVPEGYDLVLGNGSDELIAMISIACAKLGAKVLAPLPGFVMYAMSAKFAGMEFIGVPLNADFTLDKAAMLSAIAEHRPAVTYLAYPNNPTGTLFDAADMEEIIRAVGDTGVVIVDEAYQPFAQTSFMPRLPEFSNLIVMRTVSKLGLAGIRLGYMSASAALLEEFDKVRPPYNINVLTEAAIICLLEHAEIFEAQAAQLRAQRSELSSQLAALPGVEVFPSAANFLLIRVSNNAKSETYGNEVFTKLLEQKILVKNVGKMHGLLQNCLRITVSTPEENALFLKAFSVALVV
ncbi:histidinol-phosphate transaminase [Undibacterium sp. Ji22W]|uniref:histidinol-phosphate transaminase n=1 Tax=Undibacterium sp. Ji22W TaxID=3413038 RepID=UPI003BF1F382